MTQEEKQLLFKDLCSRLPYGVVLNVDNGKYREDKKIWPGLFNSDSLWNAKPYLRRMSSMTEEERRYLLEELGFDEDLENGELNDFGSYVYRSVNVLPLFDWLNAHHFDYRGLIEKGLALEATKEIYETE